MTDAKAPLIRKPWHRGRMPTDLGEQTLRVDASQGNDTDVNRIVARFARTGELPSPRGNPQYADVTALQGDLTEMIERGKLAAEELAQLEQKQRDEQETKAKNDAEELAKLKAQQAAAQENSPSDQQGA